MKKFNWLFVFLLIVLLLFAYFLTGENRSSIFNNLNGHKSQNLNSSIENLPQVIIRGEVFLVELASSPAEQRQGLAGRQSLEADRGILFIFDQAKILTFWMKDMNFNVDLLWLKGDQIMSWEKNMSAPPAGTPDMELLQYTSPVEVDRVLELPSGTIDRLGLKPGDKIIYRNI